MHKIISASILAADLANLAEDCNKALKAGVDYIHFDVMDHHFVPNLTFGADVCKALRKANIRAPIDVHLMVDTPDDYIEPFAKAGADLIIFHPETSLNIENTIEKIKDRGLKVGLAFNPDKSVEDYCKILNDVDLILLMSVNPGFAGQSFKNHIVEKISSTRSLLNQFKSSAKLGVDGGIKLENIESVAKAGADFFVIGSGFFHANDYQQYILNIRQLIKN